MQTQTSVPDVLIDGSFANTPTAILGERDRGEVLAIYAEHTLAMVDRALAPALVGAALVASGAACQVTVRTTLVSPDILGVLAGAGLGALTGIFFCGLLFPTAPGLGALTLVMFDTLACTMATTEVTLGILTAILCAPIFPTLMLRGRASWTGSASAPSRPAIQASPWPMASALPCKVVTFSPLLARTEWARRP